MQRRPEPGRPLACCDLAVQLGLHEGKVVGMGHPDAVALCGQDGEGGRTQGLGDHLLLSGFGGGMTWASAVVRWCT